MTGDDSSILLRAQGLPLSLMDRGSGGPAAGPGVAGTDMQEAHAICSGAVASVSVMQSKRKSPFEAFRWLEQHSGVGAGPRCHTSSRFSGVLIDCFATTRRPTQILSDFPECCCKNLRKWNGLGRPVLQVLSQD